jgi:hypothetical protein
LVIGGFARLNVGRLTVHSLPGTASFCVALGYAAGKIWNVWSVNPPTILNAATLAGMMAGLVWRWWLMARRNAPAY